MFHLCKFIAFPCGGLRHASKLHMLFPGRAFILCLGVSGLISKQVTEREDASRGDFCGGGSSGGVSMGPGSLGKVELSTVPKKSSNMQRKTFLILNRILLEIFNFFVLIFLLCEISFFQ